MRALIQRVCRAAVRVGDRTTASIGPGLLVLVGVAAHDTPADAAYLANKTVNLRVFEDEGGRLNRSLLETGGELLCVSQFTLLGDCRRGRRPSFSGAAGAELGLALFQRFCAECEALGVRPGTGEFGAHMLVELVNDGPVTLLLESQGGGPG